MGNNKYNGWTNWETWNFKLWIDNEESSYNAVLEIAERVADQHSYSTVHSNPPEPCNDCNYSLSQELEEYAEDQRRAVKVETGFFADVCNSSIKEINFYEIAEAYLRDLENG